MMACRPALHSNSTPGFNINNKPHILLMGQTPPPWHGQAVATQILFEHDWPDFEVHRLRMEYSEEMVEVGRFQWKKISHLFHLIREARRILKQYPGCVLFYPPASAKWVPFLRDGLFLSCVRPLAGATVFIFHASGLPVFSRRGWLRRLMARMAYHDADVALEVAKEALTPHEAFAAKTWKWCPCAIAIPDRSRAPRAMDGSMTVLFVGSLQEGKGVLDVLKTASALKKRGRESEFRFRVVGKWFSTEFEKAARHLREEFDVEEMVEFTGELTGEAKWDAYFSADVFFFPTHYESEATPIVVMEALGAGLPVISTQWAGIPAMLDGCASAILLPVKSPEAYADAILDLLAMRSRADETARISRNFYEEKFMPARFIERVASALRSAASHSHGAPGASAPPQSPISISVYLADQNPGYDRSFGISRMSQMMLKTLQSGGRAHIGAVVSKTSQQAPEGVAVERIMPWGTRGKLVRLITDHFHPLFHNGSSRADLYYFPKGYLPLLHCYCEPSVVTIHDTIIQYDEDHYPAWRKPWEYAYWAWLLRHTLRHADRILTVSGSSKRQIEKFMDRHGIPPKKITVTYEPCMYERIPQPEKPDKENYVIHLASCEPHKRTAHLVRWWIAAEERRKPLPVLHLIGAVPPEVAPLLARSGRIVKRPFLDDVTLQQAYTHAMALILPSEIEGFGLPALEAYYLGTPVCYVRGTSVDEILGAATAKGGFSLDSDESMFSALEEVMAMDSDEIRCCGLKLRETYASEKVAERMMAVFHEVAEGR